jgi:hypothetical protein
MHLQMKKNRIGDPVKKGGQRGGTGGFTGLSPGQIWYCGKKKVHPHPFLFVGTHG